MNPRTRTGAGGILSAGAVAVALLALLAVPAAQQQRHPVSGRVLAPTMGVGGAGWLDRPEREREEAPSKAIAALDIPAGAVVADVGAGSGYYTVRLAKVVGPTGRVVATDLQPGMLALIREKVARVQHAPRHLQCG